MFQQSTIEPSSSTMKTLRCHDKLNDLLYMYVPCPILLGPQPEGTLTTLTVVHCHQ